MDYNRYNRNTSNTVPPRPGSFYQQPQPTLAKKSHVPPARIPPDEAIPSSSQNYTPLRSGQQQQVAAKTGSPAWAWPQSRVVMSAMAPQQHRNRRVDSSVQIEMQYRYMHQPSSQSQSQGQSQSSSGHRSFARMRAGVMPPSVSAPVRKVGHAYPSYSNQSHNAITTGVPLAQKTHGIINPLTHREDEDYIASRGNKRARMERETAAGVQEVRRTLVPRMGFIRNRRDPRAVLPMDEPANTRRGITHLARRFQIKVDGKDVGLKADESSDSDVDMEPPSVQAGKKTALKSNRSGARKREIFPATSSSSSDMESSSDDELDELDDLFGDDLPDESATTLELETQTRNMKVEDEDVSLGQRLYGPAEMIYLDSPPPISIALPQIQPSASGEMPKALIRSISKLILPTVLLQHRHSLPFLSRILRRGFILRCRQLGIPVGVGKGKGKAEEMLVSYEGAGNLKYETRITGWLCPLCELFGCFNTREMLAFHLSCDHSEFFVEWKIEDGNTWNVHILVPEPVEPSLSRSPEANLPPESISGSHAVHDKSFDFPYVALSPSASTSRTVNEQTVKWEVETSESTLAGSRQTTHSISTRARRTRTIRTASSITAGRSASDQSLREKDPRYPTPPPPDDPLGPSARPPYLPAKSDYGGPTVYYSSRPSRGPSVFDLLQTLPMEPFGVLGWAVIDREEEIYEADDISDEDKVMYALWARWIMLNRNVFVANYYKGAIAFIDEYWKIIHRAAGWDALSRWLTVLILNRCLSARDVAKILKHYENYTGMDYW